MKESMDRRCPSVIGYLLSQRRKACQVIHKMPRIDLRARSPFPSCKPYGTWGNNSFPQETAYICTFLPSFGRFRGSNGTVCTAFSMLTVNNVAEQRFLNQNTVVFSLFQICSSVWCRQLMVFFHRHTEIDPLSSLQFVRRLKIGCRRSRHASFGRKCKGLFGIIH
jgi:hypothetical protein